MKLICVDVAAACMENVMLIARHATPKMFRSELRMHEYTMRVIYISCLTCSIAASAFAQASAAAPFALKELVKNRERIHTGRVDYSITDYEKAERKSRDTREIFFTARLTQDQEIRVNRGDADGVVLLTTDGDPHPLVGDTPFLIFYEDGATWQRSDRLHDLARKYESRSSSRGDSRTLGISATNNLNMELHDMAWRDTVSLPVKTKYSESVEHDLHVIRVEQSLSTTTYWIDPQLDWSPIRTRVDYANGEWSEARSVLKNWNGIWFPEIVDSYSSKFHNGAKPTRTIRVVAAEFNDPSQPQQFTPSHIGISIGNEVAVYDRSMKLALYGKYDGASVISHADYETKLNSGSILENNPKENVASRTADDQQTADVSPNNTAEIVDIEKYEKLTPWEEYTRDFITRFQLNDEQTQKAWSICRECQNRAREYLRNKREIIVKIDERINVLRSAAPDIVGDEIQRLQDRRDKLIEPIDQIFRKELMPRLDRLPTRAQRQAIEPLKKP